VHVEDNSWPL